MRSIALAVMLVALAGCSGGGGKGTETETVTCPDGSTIEVEVHGDDGHAHGDGHGNATAHPDCPEPPSVRLLDVPANLTAYKVGNFSWELDNGSVPKVHSMLTSIRWSEASADTAALGEPSSWGTELVKREHQDLPVTYKGTLTFTKVGTVYLRAYMEVGEDHYWSDEVALVIDPVKPTGVVKEFVHGQGDFVAGTTPPSQSAVLGDAVMFTNDDVVPHAYTVKSAPAGFPTDPIQVAAGASSEPILLTVPGAYQFESDDLQPETVQLSVTVG